MLAIYEHINDNDIRKIEKAYLDGYSIDERIFDGIRFWFKVTNDENDIEVWLDKEDLDYLNGLKLKIDLWLEEAKAVIKGYDSFASEEGNECFLYNDQDEFYVDIVKDFNIVE